VQYAFKRQDGRDEVQSPLEMNADCSTMDNGEKIFFCEDWKKHIVEVKRVPNRMIRVKVATEGGILNIT